MLEQTPDDVGPELVAHMDGEVTGAHPSGTDTASVPGEATNANAEDAPTTRASSAMVARLERGEIDLATTANVKHAGRTRCLFSRSGSHWGAPCRPGLEAVNVWLQQTFIRNRRITGGNNDPAITSPAPC